MSVPNPSEMSPVRQLPKNIKPAHRAALEHFGVVFLGEDEKPAFEVPAGYLLVEDLVHVELPAGWLIITQTRGGDTLRFWLLDRTKNLRAWGDLGVQSWCEVLPRFELTLSADTYARSVYAVVLDRSRPVYRSRPQTYDSDASRAGAESMALLEAVQFVLKGRERLIELYERSLGLFAPRPGEEGDPDYLNLIRYWDEVTVS